MLLLLLLVLPDVLVRASSVQYLHVPSLWQVILSLPTSACGFGLLFLTRALVKPIGMTVMQALFPAPAGSTVKPEHRYEIELPTKLLTYTCVGFNAVVTAPILAHQLHQFGL